MLVPITPQPPSLFPRNPVPLTYKPAYCDALHFRHEWHGGVFILVGTVVLIGSFLFGFSWSKYKDTSIGWTVGLSGGAIVIAYLTLVATLVKK